MFTRLLPICLISITTAVACGPKADAEVTTAPTELPTPEATEAVTAAAAPALDIHTVLAGEHRSAENRARDQYRHPAETLEFFGIKPSSTVVELSPGGGWYSEILAPYLRDGGKLILSSSGETLTKKRSDNPQLFDQVAVLPDSEKSNFGEPNSSDTVLTFRSAHGYFKRGQQAEVFQAAFDVLKSGGVLGIVQHRAKAGTDPKTTAPNGYVSEAAVIEAAEAIGFQLADKSEINANPDDTTDHPEGVWTLPPSLELKDKERAKYEEIGESDRMTLKFVKP